MHSLKDIKTQLIHETHGLISKPARDWLQDAQTALSTSDDIGDHLGLYSAMAKRKLGSNPLTHTEAIDSLYSPLNIQHWSTADAGRLILLIAAMEQNPDQTQSILSNYFRMADDSERIAFIQDLILFAPADYLTVLALDAGRSNNLQLLAALTQENPYPACFYSDQEFNQMVLKALFLGLSIERVEGLEQRANADLARMGESYVVEREKATRGVPVDIWLAIGPFASEQGEQQLTHYLSHDDIGHRYYCALALSQRLSQQSAATELLRKRLEVESEPLIIKLLQDCLGKKTT